jgi:hypothetical protein
LLKQARAFGVGILLATQNPVDLDYKGLANAGTWFIGRLQTERDKARLLEGLEGVAAGTEERFDRQKMEQTLAGLGNRVFLMYNVHDDAPVTFQTRWTMSYLAGPLTRAQIKTLMDPRRPATAVPGPATMPAGAVAGIPAPGVATPGAAGAAVPAATDKPPALPPEIPQYYLPLRGATSAGSDLVYRAGVLAAATVNFVSTGSGASTSTRIRRIAEAPESALALNWEKATDLDTTLEDLDRQPYPGATFAPPPAAMTKLPSYRSWGSDFSDWAFRTQTAEVFKSPGFKETSNPGETEDDFRNRLQNAAQAQRAAQAERLQSQYAAKKATLEQRVLRAEQAKDREAEQSRGRKMQTAISLGATVLGAFFGTKRLGTGTIGRATTTMRDVSRSVDEAGDVKRAEESLTVIKQNLADLEAEEQAAIDALKSKMDPTSEEFEKVLMRPRKSDITVDSLGLVWMPYWQDGTGSLTGAWG